MAAKHEYKKLQEAITIIRDECAFHGSSCSACPFAIDSYICGITGEKTYAAGDWRRKPQYWNVPEIKLLVPREEPYRG